MIWCVLNEKGVAVSWPNAADLNGAKRVAKKFLGIDRIPKKWKVLPVDMQKLMEAQAAQQAAKQEAETTTEVPANPETT
jgi:hypothetical protein